MWSFKIAGVPVEVRTDFLVITGLLALSRMSEPMLLVEWVLVVFVSILPGIIAFAREKMKKKPGV